MGKKIGLDRHDKSILGILQEDATSSVGEIAQKVGLSNTACWRRIQNLEQNGVIQNRIVLLDPEKINLPLTVYISLKSDQHTDQWLQRLRKVVADIPEVLEVFRMTGDSDYLLKAVVPDVPGYDQVYKKLRDADLLDVNSSFVTEVIKQSTQLPLNYLEVDTSKD